MHRHSLLMRSLLSQSQTPTTPRRAVGFFGFGCPTSCPAELITQSTLDWLILLEPILSIVDGANLKRWVVFCQRRFSVQISIPVCVFRDTVNSFSAAALRHVCSVFSQLFHIICEIEWNHTNSMTCEIFLAHGLETGLADVSSRSLILMADLWGPGLGQFKAQFEKFPQMHPMENRKHCECKVGPVL